MSHIFDAKVFRDHVSLVFSNRIEKSVSITDFIEVLHKYAPQLQEQEAEDVNADKNVCYQFPKSFLGMNRNSKTGNTTVFLYKEEMRSNIMFDLRKPNVKEYFNVLLKKGVTTKEGKDLLARVGATVDGDYVVFSNCLFPNFIISIDLVPSKDKKTLAIDAGVRFGVTDVPREMCKLSATTNTIEKVCKIIGTRPPFPNFYGGHTICYGSNQRLVTIPNDHNYRPLEYYANIINQSGFNFDLLARFPTKFHGKALWEAIHGPDVPMDLRGFDGTIGHFMNYIYYITRPENSYPYEEFKREGY